MNQLRKHGIAKELGKRAIEIAERGHGFMIFALVDALTQLSQRLAFIGERTEFDMKVAALLSLAA